MKLKIPSETEQLSWLKYDVNAVVECIQSDSLVVIYGNEPTDDAYKIVEKLVLKLTGEGIAYKKLEKNFKGKPVLPSPWSFSLSNSDNSFLLVVAKSCMVGIDLEAPTIVNTLAKNHLASLIDSTLTPAEQLIWKQHPTDEHFLQLWTLKEAYLKATGVGLMDNLDRLEIIQSENRRDNRFGLVDTHFSFLQFKAPNGEPASIVFENSAATKKRFFYG